MQFAKNIPKPKLLPPKQVVLGTNRCFGWQVLPGSVKPSNANWRVTRATCFSFEKLADPSSYVWDRHPHLPDSQTWRRAGQVLVTTKTLEDQDSGWSGIQSSWFTLWRWDTQLKGHMRPSDNMKKNTFANYAYESLWIVYSPEDAPVTICQLRLPGLILIHIIFSIFFKSNLLFYFLIFSFFQGADGLNILIFTHAGPTGGCGVGRLEACAGVTCWLLGGSGRSGCTGSHVSLPQASGQVSYSCVKSYFFISFVFFHFFHISTLVNMMPHKKSTYRLSYSMLFIISPCQSHGWNPITHHFIGEIRSWCWQAPWAAAPGGCGADCWGETAAGTPGSVTAPWRRSFVREVCVLSLSLYIY